MATKKKTKNRKSKTKAADLAGLVSDLVCTCEGGIITEINAAGKIRLGYTGRKSPVGLPFADFVAGRRAKELAKSLTPLTRNKKAVRLTLLTLKDDKWAASVRAEKLGGARGKERVLIVAAEAAQKAGSKGDQRYEKLIDGASDPVVLVGNHRVTWANRSAVAMLGGGDKRRLVGKTFIDFIHADDRKKIGEDLSGLVKLNKAGTVPVIKVVNGNSRGWFAEARIHPFGDSSSKAVAIQLRDISRRITAAETANRTEERLQAVIDAVTDAVVSLDGKGKIKTFNAATEKLFTRSAKALKGEAFETLIPGWCDGDGLETYRELNGVRADGKTFPAEVMVTTLIQGRAKSYIVVARDITERRRMRDAQKLYASRLEEEVSSRTAELRQLSRQTQQILESANDGIIAIDLKGRITVANPSAAELLDRDPTALRGMTVDGAFIYGAGGAFPGQPVEIRRQLEAGPHFVPQEVRLARGDGSSFDAEYTLTPIRVGKDITGYVMTLRDITARKQAEADLKLAATVFEHTAEGLLVADAHQRVTKVNRAYCRITGYRLRDVLGKLLSEVLFTDAEVCKSMMEKLAETGEVEWEQWCKNGKGERYAARQALSVVKGSKGDVQQYAAIVNDITQRKLDEEQIRYQANYDQLTGLPNRALFMDRLARLVIESKRTNTNIGLMFIDLDGFKAVNDNLGHDAGDLLLKLTAERLDKCVRESDTVARLGGDEFTVIMPLIDNIESTVVVADRILKSLTQPFDLDGAVGNISASIGISIYPEQADDDKRLLHNADVAMYHAKRQGKANYQFYREELEEIEGGIPEREP